MDAITRANGEHAFGYTALAEMGGKHADMLMDFDIDCYTSSLPARGA
ncbi:MAG: hypothetical protein PHD32_03265 [Eubacteriales bacterium]|nr:hypothetical protein [Eubacteriales bacterium]